MARRNRSDARQRGSAGGPYDARELAPLFSDAQSADRCVLQTRNLIDITVNSVDEPAAFGYTMCRARLTDMGFGREAARSLRDLREYRHTAASSEQDAGEDALKPLPVQLRKKKKKTVSTPFLLY